MQLVFTVERVNNLLYWQLKTVDGEVLPSDDVLVKMVFPIQKQLMVKLFLEKLPNPFTEVQAIEMELIGTLTSAFEGEEIKHVVVRRRGPIPATQYGNVASEYDEETLLTEKQLKTRERNKRYREKQAAKLEKANGIN